MGKVSYVHLAVHNYSMYARHEVVAGTRKLPDGRYMATVSAQFYNREGRLYSVAVLYRKPCYLEGSARARALWARLAILSAEENGTFQEPVRREMNRKFNLAR
jgi:hypothetical protein